jgi:hypothetical protein
MLCTESSDTLYSEVAQTWTPWCGASCPPPTGRTHWQRLAGELLENLSMKNPSLDVMVAGAWPHDAHHSPLASSSSHHVWPVVATGSCPRSMDPSGMSRIGSSKVLVRTICLVEYDEILA